MMTGSIAISVDVKIKSHCLRYEPAKTVIASGSVCTAPFELSTSSGNR